MCMGSAPTPTPAPRAPRRATQPATQPAVAAQSRRARAAGDDERRRLRSGAGQGGTVLTSALGAGSAARTKKTLLGG